VAQAIPGPLCLVSSTLDGRRSRRNYHTKILTLKGIRAFHNRDIQVSEGPSKKGSVGSPEREDPKGEGATKQYLENHKETMGGSPIVCSMIWFPLSQTFVRAKCSKSHFWPRHPPIASGLRDRKEITEHIS
jgi:hypothetical protein